MATTSEIHSFTLPSSASFPVPVEGYPGLFRSYDYTKLEAHLIHGPQVVSIPFGVQNHLVKIGSLKLKCNLHFPLASDSVRFEINSTADDCSKNSLTYKIEKKSSKKTNNALRAHSDGEVEKLILSKCQGSRGSWRVVKSTELITDHLNMEARTIRASWKVNNERKKSRSGKKGNFMQSSATSEDTCDADIHGQPGQYDDHLLQEEIDLRRTRSCKDIFREEEYLLCRSIGLISPVFSEEEAEIPPEEKTSGLIMPDLVIVGQAVPITLMLPRLAARGANSSTFDEEEDEVYEEDLIKGDSFVCLNPDQLFLVGRKVELLPGSELDNEVQESMFVLEDHSDNSSQIDSGLVIQGCAFKTAELRRVVQTFLEENDVVQNVYLATLKELCSLVLKNELVLSELPRTESSELEQKLRQKFFSHQTLQLQNLVEMIEIAREIRKCENDSGVTSFGIMSPEVGRDDRKRMRKGGNGNGNRFMHSTPESATSSDDSAVKNPLKKRKHSPIDLSFTGEKPIITSTPTQQSESHQDETLPDLKIDTSAENSFTVQQKHTPNGEIDEHVETIEGGDSANRELKDEEEVGELPGAIRADTKCDINSLPVLEAIHEEPDRMYYFDDSPPNLHVVIEEENKPRRGRPRKEEKNLATKTRTPKKTTKVSRYATTQKSRCRRYVVKLPHCSTTPKSQMKEEDEAVAMTARAKNAGKGSRCTTQKEQNTEGNICCDSRSLGQSATPGSDTDDAGNDQVEVSPDVQAEGPSELVSALGLTLSHPMGIASKAVNTATSREAGQKMASASRGNDPNGKNRLNRHLEIPETSISAKGPNCDRDYGNHKVTIGVTPTTEPEIRGVILHLPDDRARTSPRAHKVTACSVCAGKKLGNGTDKGVTSNSEATVPGRPMTAPKPLPSSPSGVPGSQLIVSTSANSWTTVASKGPICSTRTVSTSRSPQQVIVVNSKAVNSVPLDSMGGRASATQNKATRLSNDPIVPVIVNNVPRTRILQRISGGSLPQYAVLPSGGLTRVQTYAIQDTTNATPIVKSAAMPVTISSKITTNSSSRAETRSECVNVATKLTQPNNENRAYGNATGVHPAPRIIATSLTPYGSVIPHYSASSDKLVLTVTTSSPLPSVAKPLQTTHSNGLKPNSECGINFVVKQTGNPMRTIQVIRNSASTQDVVNAARRGKPAIPANTMTTVAKNMPIRPKLLITTADLVKAVESQPPSGGASNQTVQPISKVIQTEMQGQEAVELVTSVLQNLIQHCGSASEALASAPAKIPVASPSVKEPRPLYYIGTTDWYRAEATTATTPPTVANLKVDGQAATPVLVTPNTDVARHRKNEDSAVKNLAKVVTLSTPVTAPSISSSVAMPLRTSLTMTNDPLPLVSRSTVAKCPAADAMRSCIQPKTTCSSNNPVMEMPRINEAFVAMATQFVLPRRNSGNQFTNAASLPRSPDSADFVKESPIPSAASHELHSSSQKEDAEANSGKNETAAVAKPAKSNANTELASTQQDGANAFALVSYDGGLTHQPFLIISRPSGQGTCRARDIDCTCHTAWITTATCPETGQTKVMDVHGAPDDVKDKLVDTTLPMTFSSCKNQTKSVSATKSGKSVTDVATVSQKGENDKRDEATNSNGAGNSPHSTENYSPTRKSAGIRPDRHAPEITYATTSETCPMASTSELEIGEKCIEWQPHVSMEMKREPDESTPCPSSHSEISVDLTPRKSTTSESAEATSETENVSPFAGIRGKKIVSRLCRQMALNSCSTTSGSTDDARSLSESGVLDVRTEEPEHRAQSSGHKRRSRDRCRVTRRSWSLERTPAGKVRGFLYAKECQHILEEIGGHPASEEFKFEPRPCTLPDDYYKIVRRPMWLIWIRFKLKNGRYTSLWQFVHDIRRIFYNCRLYNPPGDQLIVECASLERILNENLRRFFPDQDFSAMFKLIISQIAGKYSGHQNKKKKLEVNSFSNIISANCQ